MAIGGCTSFVGCVNTTFLEIYIFFLVDVQRRTLDGAASGNRAIVTFIAGEGIGADVTCMPETHTAISMAGGTDLRPPPDGCRAGTDIVKGRCITVTIKSRATAECCVVLARKVFISLTAITAGRNVEWIFRRYDQAATTGTGGMFKGAVIVVAFDALVNPIVINIMPCVAASTGRRHTMTAITIAGGTKSLRSPYRGGTFKMAVDVGTAAEEISAGFIGGLGERGVVKISGRCAVDIPGF